MIKKNAFLAIALVLVASVFAVKSSINVVNAQEVEGDTKVVICHRTNSANNPYVSIEVDQNSVDGVAGNSGNGKPDHYSEHQGPIATTEQMAQELKDNDQKWGDIIPPVEGFHEGLNWTVAGQIIYRNGCAGGDEITEVVPAAPTFKAPTCEAKGSYTIPTTENVTYSVNGTVTAAGTYEAANGSTVTVTAEAGDDYYISDETADSWSYTFTAPTNCGGQVLTSTTTTPQVTQTPQGAVNAGAGSSSTSVTAVAGLISSLAVLCFGLLKRRSLLS